MNRQPKISNDADFNDLILERITPKIIGEIFAHMDSGEQAEFFNTVAVEFAAFERDFTFQLQFIADEKGLTDAARNVMSYIGHYAQPKSIHTPPVSEGGNK